MSTRQRATLTQPAAQSARSGKRASAKKTVSHQQHLRALTAQLAAELEKCAASTDPGPVHHVRTGTRRLQATLETVVREAGRRGAPLKKAEKRWLRLLKRVRRAAAPVRDLDVQRELLERLRKSSAAVAQDSSHRKGRLRAHGKAKAVHRVDEALKTLAPLARIGLLEQEVASLDRWLEGARNRQACLLRQEIARHQGKLEKRAERFAQAMEKSKLAAAAVK